MNLGHVKDFLTTMREGLEKSIEECEALVRKKRAELKRMGGG